VASPDEDDDFRSAADDPTAMWDDAALKEAGLDELAGRTDARDAAGPATSYGVRGDRRNSVELGDREDARSSRGAAPKARGGLSWPVTVILALALGVAVYFLVRMLR
jgi:hypothetical protein